MQDPETNEPSANPETLRPYVPPGIGWEEDVQLPFGLASACAKASGQSDDCSALPAS
jgi:hypothetical protein